MKEERRREAAKGTALKTRECSTGTLGCLTHVPPAASAGPGHTFRLHNTLTAFRTISEEDFICSQGKSAINP